jgi:hypothetical protein
MLQHNRLVSALTHGQKVIDVSALAMPAPEPVVIRETKTAPVIPANAHQLLVEALVGRREPEHVGAHERLRRALTGGA